MKICALLMGMSNKIQDIFTQHFEDSTVSVPLSGEMRKAAANIIRCRTKAKETYKEQCPDGQGFYAHYDSCKHRGCPQCQEIENQKWLHKKKQLLLPGSHLHFFFKLPDHLVNLWLYNKAEVANCMFSAVTQIFKRLQKKDGMERGLILVFHSNSKQLSYQPHVHCLVSFGGFTQDQRWIEKRLSSAAIESQYKNLLQKHLLRLINSNGFRIPPGMQCTEEILNRYMQKWRIFGSEIYKTGEGVLAHMTQHIKQGVISEKEIIDFDKNEVIFKQGNGLEIEIVKLKVGDFIVRYLEHIPPQGFKMVWNIGLYANRSASDKIQEQTLSA